MSRPLTAALALAGLLGLAGCASTYHLTLMPRDSGKTYSGSMAGLNAGQGPISITIEGKTYNGTWVESAPATTTGWVGGAGYGHRGWAWGWGGGAIHMDNPGGGAAKALLALGILALVPELGYGLDTARAVTFHFMAIGQLLLTYPCRHTWVRPLPNVYLHLAVATGVAIQLGAAVLPFTSRLLGGVALPLQLWGVVFGGAVLAWALAEALSRIVWRHHN